MNKFCLCFVLFCAATVFGFEELQCEPKSTYKDDCNTCVCSDDGKYAMCTLMACPRQTRDTSQVCTPGDTKMLECNRCRCAATGIGWICTRKACPSANGWQKRSVVNPITKCQPGDSWKEDCNNCFCTATGLPVCTKMGCPGSFGNFRRKRNEPTTMRHVTLAEYDASDFKCTPQEFFKLECNTCKCGPDGKTVTRCTKKHCVDGQ